MNTPIPKDELDPLYLQSRKEIVWILSTWAFFAAWVVGYGSVFGFGGESGGGNPEIQITLGMPTWVFWGVALPWLTATLFTIVFALFIMKDHPLEKVAGEEIEQDRRDHDA